MKLKQVALTLLAALTASASLYAQNGKVYITKGMAETEVWEDEYGTAITYTYNIKNKDIVLDKSIAYGYYNDAYFYWSGQAGGTYTVSGKGKLTGYGQYWHLEKGTYVIEEGTSLGDWAGVSGSSCDLVVNSNCKIWELGGINTLYVNAPKFQVTDYIYDVDTIVSTCDIQTKNFNGLIGNGVSTVEGNVVVNGGLWHSTYYTLNVQGNVNFASKTNIDIYAYEYGEDYGKPSAYQIQQALYDIDDTAIMTCSSYSGNLANLTLRIGYYANEDYDEKFINASSYGTFVPLYNILEDNYYIVYILYSTATTLSEPSDYDETYDTTYYDLYNEDVYLKGNANLSKTGDAIIEWNSSGDSVCMLGKGSISAKGDLIVGFYDGYYTIDKNVSFKKANYYIENAVVTFSGAVAAKNMQLSGSVLSMTAGKLTVDKTLSVRDYAAAILADALTTNDLIIETGSALSIETDKAKSVTVKGLTRVADDSDMTVTGNVTTTALEMENAELLLYDKSAKDAPMALTVKNSIVAENNSYINLNGKLSAGSMDIRDSHIYLTPSKAQSLTVKGESYLENSVLHVGGKMSTGSLEMNGGSLSLYDPSGKNAAMGLTVKGDCSVYGNAKLYLSGGISAKNLTLGTGCIYMQSAKCQTIKVGNELTLSGGTVLNFGFSVTQKDVDSDKTFKILTFKHLDNGIEAGDLYSLLGIREDICTLDFDKSRKSITLEVENYEVWNTLAEAVRNSEIVAAVNESEDMLFAPAAAAGELEPELKKAADTLVQSTWGTVGAARAFADAIGGRGTHATLLDGGKGSAWISTMGGSSRISSDAGHAGADYTLTGAAFGMEAHLTDDSTLGIAVGNSWGKVSTFSAYPVDQDSTHAGIYGNHRLNDTLSLSWMATHTRTESDVNLAGLPCSWSQDALQLDTRLTWTRFLDARTTVSAFGGLQYLATDSGECNGIKTGSLQNLRVEVGVGATHRFTGNTVGYGELSFIGDVVRNNPTADLGGIRAHGSNPGRAGLNLSVGASHRINKDWSVNASYNFELMQNSTSHGLNVGATYNF